MNQSSVKATRRAAYPACKPSGVPWLCDIPEHWEIRRLKYCADLINTKVDGAHNDLPYTGLEHIESWTGKRVTPNGETTNEGQANIYRRGDVLFGKLRPYLAKAHAAESDGMCTGELLVLRPKAVIQRFLLYYVLNPDFIRIVDSSAYGAKMPRANWSFIGNLPVLIPSPDEQADITSFLDRKIKRCDSLISKAEQIIGKVTDASDSLIHEYRLAITSVVITGKIDVRKEVA
jgi:restriction endonuclease S subunit